MDAVRVVAPNIMGARPGSARGPGLFEQPATQGDTGYASTSVGTDAAADTSVLGAMARSPSMYDLPPMLSIRPGRRTLSPMELRRLSPSGRRLLDTTVPQMGHLTPADIQHEIDVLESEIGQLAGQKPTVSGKGKRGKIDLSAVKSPPVWEGPTGSRKSRSKLDSGQDQSDLGEAQGHSAGLTINRSQAVPRSVEPVGAIAMTNRSSLGDHSGLGQGSDVVKRSLPTIKLDSYDGSNPLETHLAKLENCAVYYGWSAKDRLCHLKASLTGQAGEVLWQLTSETTEEQLTQLLKNRFGSGHQTERFRAELQSRRRKQGESVQSVYNDIRRLLALSFPGQTGEVCEILGRDAFLNSLADPVLRTRVLDQSPKTLDEALAVVSRMEAYAPKGEGDSSVTDGRKRVHNVNMSAERDNRRLKQLENDLADQRRQVQQLQADNQYWRNRAEATVSSQPPAVSSWPPADGGWQSPPVTVWQPTTPASYPAVKYGWNAGPQPMMPPSTGSGPQPTPTSWIRRGRGRGRGRGQTVVDRNTCRLCHGYGHWQASCPFQSAPSTVQDQANINGVSASDCMTYTHLNVVLNGVTTAFLLDSGSERNLIPKRLIPQMELKPCKTELYAANGSQINVLGSVCLPFLVNGIFLSAELLVTCDIDEPILGYRWLCENRCQWRFDNATMMIRGILVRLSSKLSHCSKIRRIYVRENTTVPADCCANVPIKLPACSRYTPSADWLIEPKEIRPGLLLSRSLVSDKDHFAAVKILNMSGKDHTLPAELRLGDAEVGNCLGSLYEKSSGTDPNNFQVKTEQDFDNDETVLKTASDFESEWPPSHSREKVDGAVCVDSSPPTQASSDRERRAGTSFHEKVQGDGMIDKLGGRHRPDAVNPYTVSDVTGPHGIRPPARSCSIGTAGKNESKTELSKTIVVDENETIKSDRGDYSHVQTIVDTLPSDLTVSQRERAIELIHRNADLFSRGEFDIGHTHLMEAAINTGHAAPIAEPLRRHAKIHLDVIDETVEKLKQAGIVEECNSPWSANLVVVSKPGSPTPRITVDLRRLNAVTSRECYPLPLQSESLDFLSRSVYLSVLDVSHSYFTVPLNVNDRDKTAFTTRRGQFRFCVLPQGAKNSPAIFSRLMSLVLRGLTYLCALSFIDDIIVVGRTFDEHLLNLELVFNRFQYARLKLKSKKCRLFQREVVFLGHRVTGGSVSMDESKVACVKDWPFPKTISDLRAFLGFANYYRNYVPGFSTVAEPLNECLRKNVQIVQTEERLRVFEHIKTLLTTAPALGLFRKEGDVVIDVDASGFGASAICQQWQDGHLRVLEYASRCFSKAERNYCATRREMCALIFALKHFRPYLLGRKFLCRVDNLALSYCQKQKNPTPQIARYLDFMSDFEFEIEHRRGSSNTNADSLSRLRPCEQDDGEPCWQCNKRFTGKHTVKVVQAKRNTNTSVCNVGHGGEYNRKSDSEQFLRYPQQSGNVPLQLNVVQTRRQAKLLEKQNVNADWCQNDDSESKTLPPVTPKMQFGRKLPDESTLNKAHKASSFESNIQGQFEKNTPKDDAELLGEDQQDLSPLTQAKQPRKSNLKGGKQRGKPLGLLGRTAPNAAAMVNDWDPQKLKQCQLDDPDIGPAIGWLESGSRPNWKDVKPTSPALRSLWQQFDSLVTLNGVLHRVFYDRTGEVKFYQVIIPHNLKTAVLELIHCDVCAHLGYAKCIRSFQERVWWYNYKQDLHLFIQCCCLCSAYTRKKAPKQAYLNPQVIGAPCERWSIDLCGEFPSSNGYKLIFTAICPFSKFAVATPIRNKEAVTVARTIMEKIILKFGLPFEVLSDGGREFCNEISDELYRMLGIKKLKTTARQPRSNGVIEVWHRTLNSLLAKVINETHTDWSKYLDYVVFSYNAAPHSVTGLSPYVVMMGRQPCWNIDLLLGNKTEEAKSVPEYTANMLDRLHKVHNLVREHLGAAAQYMSTWYNKTTKPATFCNGDRVRIYNAAHRSGRCPKWQFWYGDVGTIKRKLNDATYLVSCPNWREDRLIHADKLRIAQEFSLHY